jgi:hypothetical protein
MCGIRPGRLRRRRDIARASLVGSGAQWELFRASRPASETIKAAWREWRKLCKARTEELARTELRAELDERDLPQEIESFDQMWGPKEEHPMAEQIEAEAHEPPPVAREPAPVTRHPSRHSREAIMSLVAAVVAEQLDALDAQWRKAA